MLKEPVEKTLVAAAIELYRAPVSCDPCEQSWRALIWSVVAVPFVAVIVAVMTVVVAQIRV